MTAEASVLHASPPPRTAFVVATRRLGGVTLVLVSAAVATILSHEPATAGVISYLAKYSPSRFAHGRVWTLPASVLLLGHPRMLGPTTFFVVLLLVPYALVKGVAKAGGAALAGHCVSTLAVAAVVLPGAALGWAAATATAHRLDYGASAALAAVAGALAIVVFRRWRLLGGLVLAAVAWIFVDSLLTHSAAGYNVADVEHLVALSVGAAVEWLVP